MFRLIGFIISLYVAYCVLTSHFVAEVLHFGVWILIALAVLAVSGMVVAFATSGSSGGGYSGGYASSRGAHGSSSRGSSVYDREYARQMRMQTRDMRFEQFHAASEARNERWRQEDAAEQARHDAAVRQGRQW